MYAAPLSSHGYFSNPDVTQPYRAEYNEALGGAMVFFPVPIPLSL